MVKIKKNDINFILIKGLVIRVFCLVIIFTIGMKISDPYFIKDDIKYEEFARLYMNYANHIFDYNVFNQIGGAGFLEGFWPWVVCVLAYITKSVYASRLLNIILSTLTIKVIYNLVNKITDKKSTAILSAKLYAYLPITVFLACFPIKDIFLTFSVFYLFEFILDIYNKENIKIYTCLISLVLAIAVSNTRSAVVEMLIIFLGIFLVYRFYKEKKYVKSIVVIVIGIVFMAFNGDTILNVFETKIHDYKGYSSTQINSVLDIYKLPFMYFWATLQPMTLNFFTRSENVSIWLRIMTLLNISIYPIAVGNIIYVFKKKHNLVFWMSGIIMYCSIISLSLGVFRHYIFLLPLEIINYSLFIEKANNIEKRNMIFVSILILSFITILSIITTLI